MEPVEERSACRGRNRPYWSKPYWSKPHGSRAHLIEADLTKADLTAAYLSSADLSSANLSRAELTLACFAGANLTGANLTGANLYGVDFLRATLIGANLTRARLERTVLGDTDLTDAKGLDSCRHYDSSILDHQTLTKSGRLPLSFLRGCGLPEIFIDHIPALFLDNPIEFYSCFISYANTDHDFVERLYADLQNKGVRCWFAPEDLKIGDRIRDTIEYAIRVRDKLLIVLSAASVISTWVKNEVEAALEEERKSGDRRTVLFPITIDHAVEDTDLAWAQTIRRTRHIGDFIHWKEHDAYQHAFARLLRDLTTEDATNPS